MPKTTPPRPIDVEAIFPGLSRYRRQAIRLHPRKGNPDAYSNSIGGPMLWPEKEPWPSCSYSHKKGTGHLLSEVKQEREILHRSRSRNSPGLTEQEREALRSFRRGRHAPELSQDDPIPMLPIAQLYADAVSENLRPEGADLLQVFWCPFEKHGANQQLNVELYWRTISTVTDMLTPQPAPEVVGSPELVPSPCNLSPEKITEYEYLDLVDDDLQQRVVDWEGPEEEGEYQYIYDLSIAPGWKTGGYASWPLTGPQEVHCDCGADMVPLLTISSREWDSGSLSWIPVEDLDSHTNLGANTPTDVYAGRGQLFIFVCSRETTHQHKLISQ